MLVRGVSKGNSRSHALSASMHVPCHPETLQGAPRPAASSRFPRLAVLVQYCEDHSITVMMTAEYVLLGDIGGTNIRLSLVPAAALHDEGAPRPGSARSARYATACFGHAREALAKFVDQTRESVGELDRLALCVLSVCGPVVSGVATCLAACMGEHGWILEEADLAATLRLAPCRLKLVNDFVAVGSALPLLHASDKITVHAGTPIAGRPLACLGPGTGLGNVFGVWTESGLQVCPSEGGESDFVARTAMEWALRSHIAQALGARPTETRHVKVEHVVSGSGIKNIYDFLSDERKRQDAESGGSSRGRGTKRKQELVPAQTAEELAVAAAVQSAADPSALIATHGTPGAEGTDALCVATLDLFIDALGAEAANLALRFQAFGGVHVAGGVAGKLAARLTAGTRLHDAYLSKGHSVSANTRRPERTPPRGPDLTAARSATRARRR